MILDIIGALLLLGLVVLLVVFGLWISAEPCPRCRSRRTKLVIETPTTWLCHRCVKFFGPGAIGLNRDGR